MILYFFYSGNMESDNAILLLSALAHSGRLELFRLLVRAGENGMRAGEIAKRLELPPNTLSAQLNSLARASVIFGRRDGRSIIYAVRYDRIGQLLVYLMEDCCRGAPEVRAPVVAAVATSPCCTTTEGDTL